MHRHTVTALYEIVPATGPTSGEVDALRYQGERSLTGRAGSTELALVKVRFKPRDGDRSRKIEVPIFDDGDSMADASEDLQFQAAVAGYGLALRRSEPTTTMTLEDVEALARGAVANDPQRRAFVNLVARTRELRKRS